MPYADLTSPAARASNRAKRLRFRTRHPERMVWERMIGRLRPSYPLAKNYAERGITVCAEWQRFANFLAYLDATIGRHPGKGYSLDRIDNDGNYEPGNIRWATWSQQMRNRRPFRIGRLNGT